MADVKISALPLASTPLAGTEVLPIVQSATTDQVSVANLTAGRAVSAASLTLTTTPLAVGSGGTGLTNGTSGGVLYYSATGTLASSATLAANALVIGGGAGVAPSTTTTGTGILTFLGTPSSANLAAAVTDETGSGALVFGTTPTFTTSALFPAGTVSAPGISVSGDTNTGIYFPAADTIGFVEGGSEAMRINSSGNVGIGTASPNAKLNVIGTVSLGTNTVSIGATRELTIDCATGGTNAINFSVNGALTNYITSNASSTAVNTYGASVLTFGTDNTERMRIDSSGNVGIGTTTTGTLLTVNGVATLCSGTATPAGGSTSARLLFGTTAGFGIYYGSGAPTVSAAQGSIYLRSDGSSTSTRLYVNTNGSTTWTNVTTAA